ncbi:MAG: hypothetical protein R3C45_18810 [Phycisphaerales bacterium]
MVLKLIIVLLMCVVSANPSADLDTMRRSGRADPQRVAEVLGVGLAEIKGGSRPQQCMDTFLAGELFRKADALAPGLGYDEEALARFRTMRVEYLDLAAGQLGYIGEARVLRQQGKPAEAIEALAPLLEARGDAKMRRLALLEALEAKLLLDPKQALADAGEVGEAADWVRARAYAATGDTQAALDYARSTASVSAAPAFDRLELIAGLDGLSDDERAAWAQALASVGRVEQALTVLDENAPAGSASLHATLLQQSGRLEEAADAWRVAIDAGAGPKAKYSYAACLEALAEQSQDDQAAEYRNQAIDVCRELAESDADDMLRRDAFRRWFYLSGPDAARDLIETQSALIDTDPYLRFARARVMKDTMSSGELAPELKAVFETARDDALRASAILMWAQCEQDRRASLAILTEHWDLLSTQPATADAAQRYRVELWVGLGMIDLAATQMLADPAAQPAEALLMIASALADRHEDGVQGDAQQHVLRLAGAAIAKAPDDEGVALSAAQFMLRVGAKADAVRILSSLTTPEAAPVLARALRESGRTDDALTRLDGINTPDAALERGLCLIELGKPDSALGEARSARSGTAAGSDGWWRATLLLAKAHQAMNEPAAAADVLRVSEAMYPVAGRTWLRNEIQTLKKELEG